MNIMKSPKYRIPLQVHHLSDYQQPEQEQAEQIDEPNLSSDEALRAQFELEDQIYQRFKLPLYDAFFDLYSK